MNLKKRNLFTFFAGIGIGTVSILGIVLYAIFIPIILVIVGWLIGVITVWIFGSYVPEALNLLLDTNRFNTSNLPMLFALLSLIGAFFKIPSVNKEG